MASEESTTKPTGSTTSTSLSTSLADRISKPETSSDGMNAAAQTFTPSTTSWADEVASPIGANPATPAETDKKDSEATTNIPQSDGASEPFGGSTLQEPEYAVDVKLSDMQADPNNPLYSIKNFEELGLDQNILKGIYSMNFRKPSKIQEKALPLLLHNPPTNMIGQSQSGTGKTAAFVLNILSRLDLSSPEMKTSPQALCLAPSRELARQIVGVVQVMGSFVDGIAVHTAVPTEMALRNKKVEASVVVGTPGTVMDMIKKRLLNPQHLKVLVLDEADNMLDQQGLGDQCIRVKFLLPKNIQVVLFSATFPDQVVRYAAQFAPNANQITLRHDELTVEGIKQLYLDCDNEKEKYDILVKLYGLLTIGSSIIFVRTRDSAQEIERRMTAEGHKVASLTGAYEGTTRDGVIDAFRKGEAKVLITTNVLSRGIDVQSVSMVVNYDIPQTIDSNGNRHPDPQTYLHRIGRTGRFGRVGVSVSFVANKKDWEYLQVIQNFFQTEIQRVDTRDWDEVEEVVQSIIKSSRSGTNFKMEE